MLLILVLLLALILGLSWAIYRFGFYSPRGEQNNDEAVNQSPQTLVYRDRILEMIRALNAKPYERFWIRSFDNLRLTGRYYHQADGAPLDICFHGYRGTPSRDFSGGADIYLKAGHNVLMVEQRSQCSSEGHTITFGVKERRDCLAWIQYAIDRFGPDVSIVLAGISMGAATVLMASELDLPENVKGIVADCPYTSPKAIIQKVTKEDLHLPAKLSWPLVLLGAGLFGGFLPLGVDAAQAVRHCKLPILLIHGEDDRFVPFSMSREIAAANPEHIRFYGFPGAGHGLSFLADEERYRRIVNDFFREILR